MSVAGQGAGPRDEIGFGREDPPPAGEREPTRSRPPAAASGWPAVAISSTGLSKRFRGGQLTVDGVSLAVPTGSVYGFLGPNGSGKTTTIRMLLGLIYPTSGEHEMLGTPMPAGATAVLPRVGSLVEGPA